MSGGAAVVLVSHALEHIRTAADRAIWIDGGRIQREGVPDAVVDAYLGAVPA
jgi:ABC-type polysaccharide/polyol phosphate transport system ATPase subunit